MYDLEKYISKATALIGVCRKCGGNQFRHQFATLGILLDYKYDDPILLKASILHDIIEDYGADLDEIRNIDEDGPDVVNLILEVTKDDDEPKEVYLERILKSGSTRAKILKCADRISNLTDLHLDTHTSGKIFAYLRQTEKYIIPMAVEVNINFQKELVDLIAMRLPLCKSPDNFENWHQILDEFRKTEAYKKHGSHSVLFANFFEWLYTNYKSPEK
jgi:GTP pyrophosphokinase